VTAATNPGPDEVGPSQDTAALFLSLHRPSALPARPACPPFAARPPLAKGGKELCTLHSPNSRFSTHLALIRQGFSLEGGACGAKHGGNGGTERFWMERLLEETSPPENVGQTLERDVFGRAKLLPANSPCLLPPLAPCFAPQAEEKGERAGLPHGGGGAYLISIPQRPHFSPAPRPRPPPPPRGRAAGEVAREGGMGYDGGPSIREFVKDDS
jgi:hypothetical protein